MPTPKEICLEDLDLDRDDERYLRCVALADAEPGLALDHAGVVCWMPLEPAACALRVTADDRLALVRGTGAAPLTVERAGRSLDLAEGTRVMLCDQDLLRLGSRSLRVHIHGDAAEIFPPEPVPASSFGRLARSAAAAVALGAAALTGTADAASPAGQGPVIEVRDRPPDVAPPMRRVVCQIKAFKRSKKHKKLELHATCSKGHKIRVGLRGELLDGKGKPVPGAVIVNRVSGERVVAGTELTKEPAGVKRVRFRVYD